MLSMLRTIHPTLQVSEHASWSALYYKRIIDAALAAAGAPADLVQVLVRGAGRGGSTGGRTGLRLLLATRAQLVRGVTPARLPFPVLPLFALPTDLDWLRRGRPRARHLQRHLQAHFRGLHTDWAQGGCAWVGGRRGLGDVDG